MGEIVMAFGEAKFGEGAVAAFPSEHQSGHTRGIGLEREQQHVEHEPNMFLETRRDSGRGIGCRVNHGHAFGFFDALLNLTHAGQILIELLPVASIELALQGAGILQHEIKDGMLLLLAAFEVLDSLAGRAGAEEPLKNQARIRLRRHRLGGRTPGQVVTISAGITRVAITGLAHGVAAQLQRRESGQMSDLLRHQLIAGNAAVDV